MRATIVIAARNAAATIAPTLRSLPMLADVELLVVANGCTDDTVGVVRHVRPDARVVETQVSGCGHGKNLGAEEARGQIVVWRDADDIQLPGGIEAQISMLEGRPEASFCGGGLIVNEGGVDVRAWSVPGDSASAQAECFFSCPYAGATLAIRRSARRAFRLDSQPIGDDWTAIWRALGQGLVAVSPADPVIRYVRHGAASTTGVRAGVGLGDVSTTLRSQMLMDAGIRLTDPQMFVLVNVAPAAYYDLWNVPFVCEHVDVIDRAREVFARMRQMNELVSDAALVARCERVVRALAEARKRIESGAMTSGVSRGAAANEAIA